MITFIATLVVGVDVVTSQAVTRSGFRSADLAVSGHALPSASALRLEQRLEGDGMVCTELPRLTDTIIIDLDDRARVVSMDQAFRWSKRGAWVRAYCTGA